MDAAALRWQRITCVTLFQISIFFWGTMNWGTCEEELNSIDMVINIKKSSCMRIGSSRHDKNCVLRITTCDGGELPWVDEFRYIGVFNNLTYFNNCFNVAWLTHLQRLCSFAYSALWLWFIIRGAKCKCSIDQAKLSFYRAANGIFAKIGRLASEEVMV